MKRLLLCFVVLLAFSTLFAMSITNKFEEHPYDSVSMLETYYGNGESRNPDYYDRYTISLVTFSKDDPVYSWFGHAGIVVESENEEPIMYDWGLFSFERGFYVNFLLGNLWYKCGRTYADYQYDAALDSKRSIRKIELNLTREQKRDLVNYINLNSGEKYNSYMYDMFTDNCATRIRDIINQTTNGRFELWAKSKPGYTYRQQLSKTMFNNIPLNWLYDFVLGPLGDQKATLWEEMFLPQSLADAVSDFENIAKNDIYEYDFRETDGRKADLTQPKDYFLYALAAGLVLALITSLFYPKLTTLYSIETFVINLALGLLGTLLLFLMVFSKHRFSYFNENILFINPLLLIAAFLSLKSRKHTIRLKRIYGILSTATVVLIICKIGIPSVFYQVNYSQIALVLPFYLANIVLLNNRQ